MFGLFTKKEDSGTPNILGLLSPILKMQGINLETIIPESATELRQLQNTHDIEVHAMLSVCPVGKGFIMGFYQKTDNGYVCFHVTKITDIPTALEAFAGIKNKIAELIKSNTENGNGLIHTDGSDTDANTGPDTDTSGNTDNDTLGA